MKTIGSVGFISLCLLLLGVLCGCQRGDPLNQKVSADTSNKLTFWKIHVRQSLTPEQLADLDVAIQEVKVRMMLDRVASGGEAVDEAMRERINGVTIREVLRMGYRSRLDRLKSEYAELEAVLAANSKMRTLPGHTDSADFLREKRRLQAEDLKSMEERIKQVEEKLRLYDPGFSVNQAGKNPNPAALTVAPSAALESRQPRAGAIFLHHENNGFENVAGSSLGAFVGCCMLCTGSKRI